MSRRFPAAKPKEVLRVLAKAGFFIQRRTLSSIIDQAGLTVEQFVQLL